MPGTSSSRTNAGDDRRSAGTQEPPRPSRTAGSCVPDAASHRSGSAADRFEVEREEFFERVRQGYHAIALRDPGRVRIIDAAQPLPAVTAQVTEVLDGL